ncbi:unnamed protein product [Urochloa humidicola]
MGFLLLSSVGPDGHRVNPSAKRKGKRLLGRSFSSEFTPPAPCRQTHSRRAGERPLLPALPCRPRATAPDVSPLPSATRISSWGTYCV